jgi:ABC-type uncharacterized transport system substrate-binding protein
VLGITRYKALPRRLRLAIPNRLGQQPDAHGIAPGHQAVAVVLDLVNPVCARRQLVGGHEYFSACSAICRHFFATSLSRTSLLAVAPSEAALPASRTWWGCSSTRCRCGCSCRRARALLELLRQVQAVLIEYRWAEGRPERLAEITAEFIRVKVDVIFAVGTEAALAAKHSTSVIPIVFPVAGDPVGTGLVASLSRPGGNVTGLSNQASDLAAKRLELMREVFPRLGRLAILANTGYSGGVPEMDEIDAAARTLGLEVVPVPIQRAEDIALVFEALKGRADALYVVGDPLVNTQRVRINAFALAETLPTMHVQREYVEAAGLMSYGPNYLDLNRRAADYVEQDSARGQTGRSSR